MIDFSKGADYGFLCLNTVLIKGAGSCVKTCLNTGKFPSEWKKGNVVPIHKKDDK